MSAGKSKKILNDAKSEVIEKEFLQENPEGLPDASGIVITKYIPPMKRIVFLNGRDPGVPLEFHYASKFHPLKQYKLLHGHEYNLPEEVIEHLEQCSEPQYAYRKGADGHPEMYVVSRKYIFTCRNPQKKAA